MTHCFLKTRHRQNKKRICHTENVIFLRRTPLLQHSYYRDYYRYYRYYRSHFYKIFESPKNKRCIRHLFFVLYADERFEPS